MTLEELVKETLVQKNTRLLQAKCKHEEVYCSTVLGPTGTYTHEICLDCWKSWRSKDGRPTSRRSEAGRE